MEKKYFFADVVEAVPQVYRFNMPINPWEILVADGTVFSIFVSYPMYEDTREANEEILKKYMLYYLMAPCFTVSDEDKAAAKDASYDELFDILMDNGLDPF